MKVKTSKIRIINSADLFQALNLAIGPNALKLFRLQEDVESVRSSFMKFRSKLAEDLGICEETKDNDPELFSRYVLQLKDFLEYEDDVDLENTQFLTPEEFRKAIDPVINSGRIYIRREDLITVRDILICSDQQASFE